MSCTFRGGHAADDRATPHDRAKGLLSDRMTETLDAPELAWLEAHLADCADCRAIDVTYREDRDLLHTMRVVPPPRDLWARTAAALDAEQARSSGRRVGRSSRRATAPRGRAVGARVFSFPRGGWAPVGALGSIAAVMVVGFLVGNMILGGPSSPSGTPGIAGVPTATPNALPTPITVAQADVSWVSTGADGSIVVRQAPVSDVCPSDAPTGCAPIDTNANDVVTLSVKPRSVHQSPTSGQMIVIGQSPGHTGLSMFVVNYGKATPTATPSGTPNATATPTPTSSASPTPPATASSNPATSPPTPSSPATSSPSATVEPTPPSSSSPKPSPTASIIPNVTPAPSAATMIAVASDVAVLDAQTAAYSASGAWFAFTARAHGLASGSDIYMWHAGDAAATAVTSDHRSVFAGWAGDRLIGSRANDPVATGGSVAADAAASSTSPDTTAAAAPAERTESIPVSFLVDPASLERTAIPTAIWRPAIDPTNRFVVYWTGTVALDPVSGTWRTATGRLVLAAWPLVSTVPGGGPSAEPSTEPSTPAVGSAEPSASASTSPQASPRATRSSAPAAPSATPSSTPASSDTAASPAPSAAASPAPTAGLPDDIGTAAGVDWAVAWDESGTHLAVWIGDHGDRSFGHLDLLVVDGAAGQPVIGAEPLRAQPALPGFSLADGHLVWATPSGVNGNGSQLQVYAYTGSNTGVTSGQGQTGTDTVIVVQH